MNSICKWPTEFFIKTVECVLCIINVFTFIVHVSWHRIVSVMYAQFSFSRNMKIMLLSISHR